MSVLVQALKTGRGDGGTRYVLPALVALLNGLLAGWVTWSVADGIGRFPLSVAAFATLSILTTIVVSNRSLPSDVLGTGFVLTGLLLVGKPVVAVASSVSRAAATGGVESTLIADAALGISWWNPVVFVVGVSVVLFGRWLARQGRLRSVRQARDRLSEAGISDWEWQWPDSDD